MYLIYEDESCIWPRKNSQTEAAAEQGPSKKD